MNTTIQKLCPSNEQITRPLSPITCNHPHYLSRNAEARRRQKKTQRSKLTHAGSLTVEQRESRVFYEGNVKEPIWFFVACVGCTTINPIHVPAGPEESLNGGYMLAIKTMATGGPRISMLDSTNRKVCKKMYTCCCCDGGYLWHYPPRQ